MTRKERRKSGQRGEEDLLSNASEVEEVAAFELNCGRRIQGLDPTDIAIVVSFLFKLYIRENKSKRKQEEEGKVLEALAQSS